jgi:hypothetical protein
MFKNEGYHNVLHKTKPTKLCSIAPVICRSGDFDHARSGNTRSGSGLEYVLYLRTDQIRPTAAYSRRRRSLNHLAQFQTYRYAVKNTISSIFKILSPSFSGFFLPNSQCIPVPSHRILLQAPASSFHVRSPALILPMGYLSPVP